jgi:hypothetical protein
MSDVEIGGTVFALVLGGLFVLRIVAATMFFYYILPRDDRCPNCDERTIRLQPAGWNRLVPFLRSSWCVACGWEGLLRPSPAAPESKTPARTKVPR